MDDAVERTESTGYGTRQTLPDDSIFRRIGEDLTAGAPSEGDAFDPMPHWVALGQLMTALARRKKPNAIIIGKPGVGKTHLVKVLAWMIAQDTAPPWLRDRKVIKTDFDAINALTKSSENMWPEHTRHVRQMAAEAAQHRVILFWDEFGSVVEWPHTITMLKPALADGTLSMIAACTDNEYQRLIRRDAALARRFEVVLLEELAGKELATALKRECSAMQSQYSVGIADGIIDQAVRLTDAYLPFMVQPDKAIDALDQACISVMNDKRSVVERTDIERVVAKTARVPEEVVRGIVTDREAVRAGLGQWIMGQDDVLDAVADRLFITRSGTNLNPHRPLGSFLLTGPSGVGKTELAKAVSFYLTGSEDNLIRLDMSTYNTSEAMAELLGHRTAMPRDNYVPRLTQEVTDHPYGVLLLDEFEKAGPWVWMYFLQVFDTGKLTDFLGNVLNFENMVIFLTTNVLAERRMSAIGMVTDSQGDESFRQDALKAVEDRFPAELLGRLDDILVFRPLTDAVKRSFVLQNVARLGQRLGKDITVTEEALAKVMASGFDERYGARRLSLVIDREYGRALAELKQDVSDWHTVRAVVLRTVDGQVAAEVAPAAESDKMTDSPK
jgi:ATP-dependent Clp protease ATP-binding subunit ClpC